MSEEPPSDVNRVRKFPVLSVEALRVRELRRARRLTQLGLASAAGVSERTVRAAETGRRVRMNSLERIAAALGVGLTDLIPDPGELRHAQVTNRQLDQLLEALHLYCFKFDISEFERIFSPNTEIQILGPKEIPFVGTHAGVDGLRRLRDQSDSLLTYTEPTEITDIRASGGLAVIRGVDAIRSAVTGQVNEVWWQHVYEFRDGKVAHVTETFDTYTAYHNMRLGEPAKNGKNEIATNE